MVYNEKLADRIRGLLVGRRGWTEKRMFGGMAFMLNGKMCCGVIRDDLVVRVGPERSKEALTLPNARAMDFTGKPISGFIYVDSDGWSKDSTLKKWVEMGIDYVSQLKK